MRSFVAAITVTLILASACLAQYQNTLTTTYAQNNACYGNLFDISPSTDITLCSFDVHMEPGQSTIQVWAVTGGGSWNQTGVRGNPAAWTLLGQTTIIGQGTGNPTPLNLNLGYPVPSGTIQGLCIFKTVAASPTMRYTNGIGYGMVLAANAELTVFGGGGVCSPGTFSPNTTRDWNGTVYYQLGLTTFCNLGNPPREFQLNQGGAALTISGLLDPGPSAPIVRTSPIGTQETLDLASSNVGIPWDVALLAPGSAAGYSVLGVASGGGQTVNLNLFSPSLSFLLGGTMPALNLTAFPAPTLSIPFSSPVPLSVAAQMIVLDPFFIDGFVLSHAANYTAQ